MLNIMHQMHSYEPDSVASSRLPSLSGCRIFHLVNGNDSKSFMSLIFNITIRFPLYEGTNTCTRRIIVANVIRINELFMGFHACVRVCVSGCLSIHGADFIGMDLIVNILAF